ncbi:MAG2960 family serine endopeptidase lipoprotein [Mycoplasma mycoides]|uniref:MAG2960 family serine endopeptidase lipoprotein n=1 Tax=Mycoplasma mycoides TaxID=2102 RepID=UPI00223F8137|nr:lipoprotein [Mycoplasma mycoides]QVK08424.1 lipoprotein [Mycoplasma mycoides subsp. capri]
MKKILSLISLFSLVTSSSLLVISCNHNYSSTNKIPTIPTTNKKPGTPNKKIPENIPNHSDNKPEIPKTPNNNTLNPNNQNNHLDDQSNPNYTVPSNITKLVYEPNKIYDAEKNPEYFTDSHLFSSDFLLNNSAYTISRSTNKFHTAKHNMNVFLKTGNYNNPVDFRSVYNSNTDNEFWKHTKDIGWYGDFGNSKEEKIDFYNANISVDGMVKQAYLKNFEEKEIGSSKSLNFDFNSFILENPFGFLPSNLSQLFYYMDFESISKLFNINNIVKIKANFDDEKGEFEVLITDKNNQNYYQKIDQSNTNSLKKNLDFYQYIYDRSFSILVGVNKWDRDEFKLRDDMLSKGYQGGTVWVLDRIINDQAEKEGYWELLLATNIHVFSFNKTFDKSLYFEKNSKRKYHDSWKGSFFDFTNYSDSKKAEFMTTRAKETLLKSNIISNVSNFKPTFKAEEQYLTAPYYTPRYKVSGFKTDTPYAGLVNLEDFNEATRIGSTKNGGADFVILRLKIKKEKLEYILPELNKVIGKLEEKNWHIGLGKDELFTPLKTQFYAGYPSLKRKADYNGIDQPLYEFKGNKSIGGIISTQNRYVNEGNFQSLWTKYEEKENKDWNSHHENWKKYTEPFIKDQHGMVKTVLTQHSSLFTRIEKNEKHKALDEGSSGSMAIDSSFNLIGINYLLTRDNKHNTITNAISLMQGQSDYENGFDGNIRTDFIKKLKKDNLITVKLNPNKNS